MFQFVRLRLCKMLLDNELAHTLTVAPTLPYRTLPRDVRATPEVNR